MELSTSSLSVVVLLLSAFVPNGSPHRPERTVPRIVPSKLQLFEHTELTVNCEGFFSNMIEWRVFQKNEQGNIVPCNKNNKFGPCHIPMVFPVDSGEFWCESKHPQRRSESVHITVSAADVVLESPVRPVMVGDSATLRCVEKNKNSSTEFYFYKDGVKVNSGPSGVMTIHNISESDQGQYKCSTSDKEFSGENLLKVTAVLLQSPDRPVTEGTNLILFCRDKMAAQNHMSVFYKDGEFIGISSSGELTLKVSKSDEGVYKCRSSEGRESEEQWLAVRDGSGVSAVFLSTVSLSGLIVLLLLLLLVWFIHKKYKGRRASGGSETIAAATKPRRQNQASAEPETAIYSEIEDVPLDAYDGGAAPHGPLYSTVNKKKKKKNDGAGPEGVVYSTVNKKKKKRGATEEGDLYSVVQQNKTSVESRRGTTADDSFYALASFH